MVGSSMRTTLEGVQDGPLGPFIPRAGLAPWVIIPVRRVASGNFLC
jgi:hypothetical protein